ncbi:MAG: hypothetical protein ABIG63_07520 [Chloroflexota bacterium]
MTNWEDIIEKWKAILILVTSFLLAAITLLATIKKLREAIRAFFGEEAIRFLVIAATVIIPNVVIAWIFMYFVATKPNRIAETTVFLQLVLQLTVIISVSTFLWGSWVYPKTKIWLQTQSQDNLQPSQEKESKGGEDAQKQPIPQIKSNHQKQSNQQESKKEKNHET